MKLNKVYNKKKIAILMASYNGQKYIREQIDSILAQKYKDWTLYIRDDGSKDDTLNIIYEFTNLFTNKIILLSDSNTNLGPKENFMRLLTLVESEYYMFCDQDDVWLDNKIGCSVKRINEVETEHPNKPIIVHTDSSYVDSNLNILLQSRWEDCGIYPKQYNNYNFLAIRGIQGASMLFNNLTKKTLSRLGDIPLMHDWWISTETVKLGGIISSIEQPLLLYRQHADNVSGSEYNGESYLKAKLFNLKTVILANNRSANIICKNGYGSKFKYLFYKSILICTSLYRRLRLKYKNNETYICESSS